MHATCWWKRSFESTLNSRSLIASVRVTEGSEFITIIKDICFPTEGCSNSFAAVSFHEDSSALTSCASDIRPQYSATFSRNDSMKCLTSVANNRCIYLVTL